MPANRFYSVFDYETPGSRPLGTGEYRTPFQIDRDRIIHSSSFRRLQNKTQVFLSGEYDFYRTRLTHSIEVAQIGRSICTWLTSQGGPLGEDCWIDADLVECACLAHDLGHPPFGHTGERTLHRLMQPYGGFEGNAQTLRILTQTLFNEGREGMDPTRALMDGVLKYKTLQAEKPDAANHFLYSDQESWLDFTMGRQAFPVELIPGKVRNQFRSIECQIMDWADDTAYSLNDIADGIHAGFINVTALERWGAKQDLDATGQEHLEKLCKAIREGHVERKLNSNIGRYIRSVKLVPDSNFLSAMTKRYQYRLEIDPALQAQARMNKRIALDLVFKSPQLQQLDYKADVILTKLFGVLHDRYIEHGHDDKGLHLIPATVEEEIKKAEDEAKRARLVCDWVASMTDSFAFRTYRRLFDAGFGSITDFV